jgi:hypothetical protein
MDGPLQARQHPLKAIARPGIEAVRRMWVPFVVIQLAALALVIVYFQSAALRAFCDRLAAIKEAGGLAFAAGAMVIASAVLPEALKAITGADEKIARQRGRDIAFNSVLYAVNGVLSNWFYILLARWFPGASVGEVIAKVAIDMLVYTPFVGIPWMALLYTWREHRYRPVATIKSLGGAWYLSRVTPILLPCWAYWIPMCVLMYVLPTNLTFLFGVTGNGAAAVILITIASRKTERADREQEAPRAMETVDV